MNEENIDGLNTDEPEETVQEPKAEDASSISSDLIRGHINTIILRALYERDKYGYEIITDIEKKSHGQYTLKQPTLYSALKRLENQGYIKAYWKTDEVSSGGRRKYFKLTESGKEVTETNLAEWEYSRTIIDNLISDRAFDFSQPAPTPVDMTILRDSVSRTPIIKSDEKGRSDDGDSVAEEKVDNQPTKEVQVTDLKEQLNETYVKPANEQSDYAQKPLDVYEMAAINEQRRITHENYLRLISTPVKEEPKYTEDNIVPNSENINTGNLIYNTKPEPERDYKNLIDGIFNKAINNGSVQATYEIRRQQPTPSRRDTRQSPQDAKITDKGRADGISVLSSAEDLNAVYATKTTYNKGLTLLKCSAIVLAILVVEFILCAIFKTELNVNWTYPIIILTIGVLQFTAFGLMYIKGYGQNSVRPTTNGYISTCIILNVILVLIICIGSFLLNMNATLVGDIFKMIVIPSIAVSNITVFALFFRLFIK